LEGVCTSRIKRNIQEEVGFRFGLLRFKLWVKSPVVLASPAQITLCETNDILNNVKRPETSLELEQEVCLVVHGLL
jgi:hypothetical protein